MNKRYTETGFLSRCSDCATGLGPKDRVSIYCFNKRYCSSSKYPNWLWDPPSLISNGYQKFFLRELKRHVMKLTNHLPLMPRLKCAELNLRPHCAFLAWC